MVKSVKWNLDTGAAVSTMAFDTFKTMFPDKKMSPTSIKLTTCTGEIINPVGSFTDDADEITS